MPSSGNKREFLAEYLFGYKLSKIKFIEFKRSVRARAEGRGQATIDYGCHCLEECKCPPCKCNVLNCEQ